MQRWLSRPATARASASRSPWIVVAPPKRMAALRSARSSLGPVSVADGFAPPENVLFLANELRSQRGVDQRAAAITSLVPAGFGVKITDGLAGDLDRWRDGYESFADRIGMRAAEPIGVP